MTVIEKVDEDVKKDLENRFSPTSTGLSYETKEKKRETLQTLYSDVRRLAAFAFSKIKDKTREVMSCDYFLDALRDPDFALKI